MGIDGMYWDGGMYWDVMGWRESTILTKWTSMHIVHFVPAIFVGRIGAF
ncbi:MAG: hypothetical protein H0X29_01700 [Parachlamydiaceae bacterium]|nr:hypothetical protein [Parachlamydiaceae bacterium]